MQYLIHDLLKLPTEDRLIVIEKLLYSILPNDLQGQITKKILAELQPKDKPIV